MKKYKKRIIGLCVIACMVFLALLIRLTPNEIEIGIHCGMCSSRCFDVYKLTDNAIEIDSTSGFRTLYESKKVKFEPFFQDENYRHEISLPVLLYLMPSWTFGYPDSYDQCGYYIGVHLFGNKKTFAIDPDQVPVFLDKTVDELKKEMQKINKG